MTDGPQRVDRGRSSTAAEDAPFGSQARLLVSPDVPASEQAAVLRDARAFEPDAAVPEAGIVAELVDLARNAVQPAWLGSALVLVVGLAGLTAAARETPRLLGQNGGPQFPAWVIPAVPAVGLLVSALITLIMVVAGRRGPARTRRIVARWSDHVTTKDRQARAAKHFPELARRLAETYLLVDRLHGYDGVLTNGWLPGLSPARVDELHHSLVERLLATVPLRTARAEAQARPAVAGQVATADTQLAEADAAFDEDLERLRQLYQAAREIAGRLHDLRLAERLDAATAQSSTRDRLRAPLDNDLPALTAAALESVALVHAALDPARLRDTAKLTE